MHSSETLVAYGRVEEVSEHYAYIRTQRESGCGGCQSEQTCGTSTLARLFSMSSQPLLKLPNHINARPGDQVELALEGHSLIHQAFMAYGLPLVGMFAGALLALLFWPDAGDMAAISGSLVGLVVAWGWVKHYHHPLQPKLVRVVLNKMLNGEESKI
ncbi:SoxR reducing system RseC family protein [Thiomicrospira sp.]|uniref:SoxR reducing system RseC family protein n=1 Tax=Thiomicrospira sp. TaxID=935 RepID=UPI002F94FB98